MPSWEWKVILTFEGYPFHDTVLLGCIQALLKCAVPRQRGTWMHLKRTVPVPNWSRSKPRWTCVPVPNQFGTCAKLVQKQAAVDHYPMWSRVCRSELYCTLMDAWTQTRTIPHWYAMWHTQELGAKRTEWVPQSYALYKCTGTLAKRITLARYELGQHGTVQYGSLLKTLERSFRLCLEYLGRW